MALGPLTHGPHAMRADRLAFATPVPVREAGREGWITLHAADSDEGTVHVYVGSGGYIEKGPKALTHQHIGAIASHPSVARTTRHPAGHEPPGARDHPDFHEAGAKPRTAPSVEGEEPARRPGKPYARLHGPEQGTRAEAIGKALSQAQRAARAHATGGHNLRDRETVERLQDQLSAAVGRQGTSSTDIDKATAAYTHLSNLSEATGKGNEAGAAEHRAKAQAALRDVRHLLPQERPKTAPPESQPEQAAPAARAQASPARPTHRALSEIRKDIEGLQSVQRGHAVAMGTARAGSKAHTERSQRYYEAGRQIEQLQAEHAAAKAAHAPKSRPFSEPTSEETLADAAVVHQQAQADLAAHRAAHDRNPNPWAPHLSPPVGDAKDSELAEKATRAQLAHQAAQAQAQGAQQQQQSAEQRAHEKEMARLKAHRAQPERAVTAPLAKEKPRPAPRSEHPVGHEGLPPVSRAIADSVARGLKRVDKDNIEQMGRAHSAKQIEGTINAIKQRYPAATVNHDEVAQRIHAATPTYRVNSGHAGRLQELRDLKERIAKTHRVKGEQGHPLVQPAFKALDERIAHHRAQYQATLGRAKEEAGHAAEIMVAHQSAARASHQANSAPPEAAQPRTPQARQRMPAQQTHEARVAEHPQRLALESQIIERAQRQQHHSRQGAEPNHYLSIAHGTKKDQLLRQYRRQFGDDAYEGMLDRVEEAAGRKMVRESGSPADHFRAPVASAR